MTILALYVVALAGVTMGYGLFRDRAVFVFGGFAMYWIGYVCLGAVT